MYHGIVKPCTLAPQLIIAHELLGESCDNKRLLKTGNIRTRPGELVPQIQIQ